MKKPFAFTRKTKQCYRCKKEFPLENFHNNPVSSDGKHPYCKPCAREYGVARRAKSKLLPTERWEERIAVYTPTRKIYNALMEDYESMGMKWRSDELPTNTDDWDAYKKETCIDWRDPKDEEGEFGFADRDYYEEEGAEIITYKQWRRQYFAPKQGPVASAPRELIINGYTYILKP